MERSPRLKCIALGCVVILFYVMPFSMAIKFNCRDCLDQKGTELIWNMENDAPECSRCRERDTYNDGRFFFCQKCRNCSESSVLHNCTSMQDTMCEGDAQDKAILKDYDVSENEDPCKYFSDEDLKRFITTKCQTKNAECGQPEKEKTTESSYSSIILVIVCIVLAIVVIILSCFCWVFRHKFTCKSSGSNPPQKPKDAEGEEDIPPRSSKQKGRHDKDDTYHSDSENKSSYSGYHSGSESSENDETVL